MESDSHKQAMPDTGQSVVVEQSTSVRVGRFSRFSRHLNYFDKLARALVMLVVFVLPIFFMPFGNLSVEFSKHAFVAFGVLLAFLAWTVARLETGVVTIPKSPLVWGSGILALGYTFSTLVSPDWMKSFFGLGFETGTALSLFVWVLLLFFSSIYFRSESQVAMLYKTLLGSSLLVFAAQVVHVAAPDLFFPSLFTLPTDTLIGKWNDFGIFFGLIALLSLFSLELPLQFSISSKLAYLTLAVSVLVVVVTNVPFVLPLLALASLALLVYRVTSGFSWSGYRFTKAAVVRPALVVLLVSVFFSSVSGLTVRDDQNIVLNTLAKANRALLTWENSLGIATIEARPSEDATLSVATEVFKTNALFGAGPNRFDVVWRSYKPDTITQSLFWNTDFSAGYGYVLTAAVTVGWVGIVAWALFFLGMLYTGVRGLRRTAPDSLRYTTFLSLFMAAIYLWVLAILYVPENVILALAFIFSGVLVGLEVHWGITKLGEVNFFSRPRLRFVSVFGFLLLALMLVGTQYVLAQKTYALSTYRSGLVAAGRGDLDAANDALERAAKADPQDLYFRSLAEVSISRLLQNANRTDLKREELTKIVTDLYQRSFQAADLALRRDPTNFQNQITLGNVYAAVAPVKVEKTYESAVKAYQDALVLNPKNPQPYLALARLELALGNTAKARDYAKKGIEMKPNFAELVFLLSQIEAKAGNIDASIESAKQSAALAPTDVGVWFQLGVLLFTKKDYQNSVLALEQAVSLNSNYSNARYFLGMAYDALGDKQKALAQFETIRGLNPENQEVSTIIANLKAGRGANESLSAPAEEDSDDAEEDEE